MSIYLLQRIKQNKKQKQKQNQRKQNKTEIFCPYKVKAKERSYYMYQK